MKTIGYIVTDRKLNDIEGFVEQVNDYSEADPTKPILIIGWQNAKTFEGYNNILDRKLGDKLFWTFKKSESRYEFEQDLKKFYAFVRNNILNNLEYYYIDIFKLKYSKLKKLYNIFNSDDRKNIYINNGLIYTMYNNKVLGVSLEVLEYCGIKRDKVLSLLDSNPNNTLFYNTSRGLNKLSRFLGNKKYAIPYFISS